MKLNPLIYISNFACGIMSRGDFVRAVILHRGDYVRGDYVLAVILHRRDYVRTPINICHIVIIATISKYEMGTCTITNFEDHICIPDGTLRPNSTCYDDICLWFSRFTMLYFLHACYKNILFNLYVTYNVFEEQQIILIKFTINLVVIWPFSCFLQYSKTRFFKFQGLKCIFKDLMKPLVH